MPRDFETYWKKDSKKYKDGWKPEPFQVKGDIARHHEKTKQDSIEESNLEIPPAKQKNMNEFKYNNEFKSSYVGLITNAETW